MRDTRSMTGLGGKIRSMGTPVGVYSVKVGKVFATPMSYAEFNEKVTGRKKYPGNPEEMGYLVQSMTPSESHYRGFSDYVWWLPEEVFVQHYGDGLVMKMYSTVDELEYDLLRLIQESALLEERLSSLDLGYHSSKVRQSLSKQLMSLRQQIQAVKEQVALQGGMNEFGDR